MLAYEEIFKNAPTLKSIVEGKISEEVAKVKAEYDTKLTEKQQQIDEFTIQLGDLMLGGM
jgi:type III secretion system FlhB-like substrate exporter